MISMKVKGECPYCNEEYERSFEVESDTEGDYIDTCDDCGRRFLIHWLMLIDATTMSISEVAPPVRCDVDLDYWFDDDAEFKNNKEIKA